jgi:hypothetical protein
LALALAAGVGELILRQASPRAREEAPPRSEPLRRRDPHLGWVFAPSRVGHDTVAGRVIDYTFDARGYRVPNLATPVDPARPTLLFTGESIMTGYGLRWPETIPAQVGAALDTQSVNLSVFGYADDQAYMRLASEFPRFARPRAVVILFSPDLLFRDFDVDRPHLGAGLAWRPATGRTRLEGLLRFYVPYHSHKELDALVALVRAELSAGVNLARARHACALIVVPHFSPEDPTQDSLRRRILDEAGLPYVRVDLDPRWRFPGDRHPDARGARLIAATIVAGLRRQDCFGGQSGPSTPSSG